MRTLTAILASALLLAACADTTTAASAQSAQSAQSTSASSSVTAPSADFRLETFTSDANGYDTHSFWLDTGREVVVFDAQFTESYANQLIADIRSKTTSPIRWVVVTHPNPDKFNGVTAFQKVGAKAIASARTAQAIPGVHAYKKAYFVHAGIFTDATYPAEAKIDVTFDGDYELPLEGRGVTVRLHELAHRGVSSTQTIAFVPQLDALVVGDLVHHQAHAWLEGGIVDGKPTPDLASWALALDELRAYGDATVYGGRGEPAKASAAVNDEKAYLAKIDALVTKYVAEHGASNVDYKELARDAAAAFPDYALPYMIEYGAYGLVGAIAASLPASGPRAGK